MLGRILGFAAGVIAVSVGMTGIVGHSSDMAKVETATATADDGGWNARGGGWSSASSKRSSSGEVRLSRAGDSHFYADVEVEGTDVRMMVDTGASMIALTRRDAEAIGIDVDRLPITGSANTAGGVVPMRTVMLDSVDVDGVEVRSVEAAVIDADMGTSLLGQSYLSKLSAVNVEGDTMTLR